MPTTFSSYQEIAESLTPAAVSAFLAASSSWELENRIDLVKEIWTRPAAGAEAGARILLPLATDYEDYSHRFTDALRVIALVNNWTAAELQQRIISTHADLLFVRLNQAQDDGTIPLGQAETTIDAIYEMLKAAAITAAAPDRSQRGGRLPSGISAFLEEDVRLGHTKRGSFVFTVVTRLGRASMRPENQQQSTDAAAIFPRRVMETLARGLETAQHLAERGATISADHAARSGISPALLESLEDLAGPEGLRSLELSFEWAAAEVVPTVGTESIRLEHAHVNELARVREQLLREEEPPRRTMLFGLVRELARDDDDLESDDSGSVVIVAEINGRKRNVHMSLNGANHRRAVESYQRRVPLIVTGDLVFERRAWRLVGDIQLDASIVERGR